MTNGYIYDPYSLYGMVPIGSASEAITGPQVPEALVQEAMKAGGISTLMGGAQQTGLVGVAGSWLAEPYISGGEAVSSGEVLGAGIGFGALVPWLMTLGRAAIPIITKYWPQLAAFFGGLSLSAVISQLGGGVDTTGGGQVVIPGTAITLGGPFAPEPPAAMIVKEWAGIGGSRFYLLVNGRIAVRKSNGTWKLIRRVKMLHMKSTNPRLGDVVKADRIIQRAVKVVKRRLPSARRSK